MVSSLTICNNDGSKVYKFKCNIEPKKIISGDKEYEITWSPKNYKIKEFSILCENDHIKDLVLYDVFHPNASYAPHRMGEYDPNLVEPPQIQYFCLPKYLIDRYMPQKDIIKFIPKLERLLETFWNESCYYTTWNEVKWKEIDKMEIKDKYNKTKDKIEDVFESEEFKQAKTKTKNFLTRVWAYIQITYLNIKKEILLYRTWRAEWKKQEQAKKEKNSENS